MTLKPLALNFAYSLTRGAWTRERIEQVLNQRLPHDLHSLALPLADELHAQFTSRLAPKSTVLAKALASSPVFQKVADFSLRHQILPALDLRPATFSPLAPFDRLDLPQWRTVQDLADHLALPVPRLAYLADVTSRHERHGDMAVNHYHYHFSPKRNGHTRLIEAPKHTLKSLQRKLLRDVLDRVPVSHACFGFVQGRTALMAASRHAGEKVVLRFDLRDFFASIGAHRVSGVFRSLGYPHTVAQVLTGLCCTSTPPRILDRLHVHHRAVFRQLHLPQGAPTSPAVSNLVCFNLDRRLSGLARKTGANCTRYADDLCFSGDPAIVANFMQMVPHIVTEEGFALNPLKTAVMHSNQQQSVLGVVVNQHVNPNRASFDRLKAIIHALGYLDNPRAEDAAFMSSLMGQLAWVEAVNRRKGHKLQRLLAKALSRRKKGGLQ